MRKKKQRLTHGLPVLKLSVPDEIANAGGCPETVRFFPDIRESGNERHALPGKDLLTDHIPAFLRIQGEQGYERNGKDRIRRQKPDTIFSR